MTREEFADLIESGETVDELMALAVKMWPWLDTDEASKMIYVISSWLRGAKP